MYVCIYIFLNLSYLKGEKGYIKITLKDELFGEDGSISSNPVCPQTK